MEWLLLTFKSLPVLKYFFEKFESYIIVPFKKWYKDYQEKQIEKKYNDIRIKEENTNTRIDIERQNTPTEQSDEELRNLHRNRDN